MTSQIIARFVRILAAIDSKLGKNNSNSLLLLDKTEISNVAGGMYIAAMGAWGNSRLPALGAVGIGTGLVTEFIGAATGKQAVSNIGKFVTQVACVTQKSCIDTDNNNIACEILNKCCK